MTIGQSSPLTHQPIIGLDAGFWPSNAEVKANRERAAADKSELDAFVRDGASESAREDLTFARANDIFAARFNKFENRCLVGTAASAVVGLASYALDSHIGVGAGVIGVGLTAVFGLAYDSARRGFIDNANEARADAAQTMKSHALTQADLKSA